MDISTAEFVKCSACGGGAPSTYQAGFPDHGWVLPFQHFGFYGGFTDDLGVLMGTDISKNWIICHDCIAILFHVFPKLAESIGAGTHPCEENTPCCKFAWRTNPNGNGFQHPEMGRWVDSPNNNQPRLRRGSVFWATTHYWFSPLDESWRRLKRGCDYSILVFGPAIVAFWQLLVVIHPSILHQWSFETSTDSTAAAGPPEV